MKYPSSVSLALGCALLAGSANAAVTVNFSHPENYTSNFAYYGNYGRQRVMEVLRTHFVKLGATLPAGQDLKFEILDIHLSEGRRYHHDPYADSAAGFEMGRVNWPFITLRYSLESRGNVLKSGEEHIKEMVPSCDRVPSGEILCAEKQMLDSWFKQTLMPAKDRG